MAKKQKRKIYDYCVFCGLYAEMHGEHVFDRWMRNYIPWNKKSHRVLRVTIDKEHTERIAKTEKGDQAHKKIYCVCGSCNNEWMSDATNAAKPIVLGMIKGAEFRVSADDQRKLRHWIAIKIITSEYSVPHSVTISDQDRDYVYKNKDAPPDWRIWIGNIENPVHTTFYRRCPYRVSLEELALANSNYRTEFNTHSTSYSVEKMFIHVVASAHPGIAMDWEMPPQVAGNLREISLVSGFGIVWPIAGLSRDQAASVMLAFQRFMTVLVEDQYGVTLPYS